MKKNINNGELESLDVIFTVCSVNYLNKAVAMLLSIIEVHPESIFIIIIADSKRYINLDNSRIKIIWAEDLGFPEYHRCAFKYNIIEFNTLIKPFSTLYLLKSYRNVTYLDPDICVFSPLLTVQKALKNNSVAFTPHALTSYKGIGRPNDIDLLRFGSLNLGFFAVKNTEIAVNLLNWWHQSLLNGCFYEAHIGLGVDQKWMDLVFAFYDDVVLIKDYGLNVAFWNLHERIISNKNGQWMVNDNYPLEFIHFSSFDKDKPEIIAKKQTRYESNSRPDFIEIAKIYCGFLNDASNIVKVSSSVYGYERFDNGEKITAALRRYVAISNDKQLKACHNPFKTSDDVYNFAKRNGLLGKNKSSSAHILFNESNSFKVYEKVIRHFFRAMLYILGPESYYNLMRFLAHYSSILNQKNMFNK
jgi:hypothetical protein